MRNKNSISLIKKYLEGTATPEEIALLESWYTTTAEQQPEEPGEPDYPTLEKEILQALRKEQQVPRKLWPRMIAAASIILCLALGGYFTFNKSAKTQMAQTRQQDILPGGNKAILTLANGKQVILTDAKNGKLATESNTTINKTASGQLTYTSAGATTSAETAYNTMTTPSGGQYALTLSDGTKVILNAASSIRYPTNFSGTERIVELTGEAYFEVAHNKAMPFHVVTKLQDVKVLGTHFDVNSYDDEPATKTTLLEGSVMINSKTVIKPGEQAVNSGNELSVNEADTELAVAWKNNKFMFDNDNIETIMRMVARWYNVKIEYTGEIPAGKFGGSVSRFDNVSKVLSILELTGNVHFKIEGRRITVTK